MEPEIMLSNWTKAVPVAAVMPSSRPKAYIIVDDGCYVLVEPYAAGTETCYRPSTHWFREAVDVLRTLPAIS